jgi:hypothetical protein
MPYITIDDVQVRMPQFSLTAVSKPTVADAQTFLEDTTAELDVSLETMGYRVPVTGSKSLAIIRSILSAGTIAKILFARAASVGGDIAVQSATRAQAQFDGYLKALKDPLNPLELIDAFRTGQAMLKPDSIVFGLRSADLGIPDPVDTEPRTTMDQEF